MKHSIDHAPFAQPRQPLARPQRLEGSTYKIKAPSPAGPEINIYITINEIDRRPFEVFLNCSDSSINELLGVTMVLISRLLRLSVPLDEVAADLQQIASPNTGHFADQQWCPSLIARLGSTLKEHEGRRQAALDLQPVPAAPVASAQRVGADD